MACATSSGPAWCHRVVARGPGRYEIRADNPGGADDIVPATSVFGAVTRVERHGHSVRLGLGPERTLVGVLVRLGLLQRLVAILRAARTPFAGHRVL